MTVEVCYNRYDKMVASVEKYDRGRHGKTRSIRYYTSI